MALHQRHTTMMTLQFCYITRMEHRK